MAAQWQSVDDVWPGPDVNGVLLGHFVQVRESVAPVAFEYVFEGHREHADLPMLSWNLPGVQYEQVADVFCPVLGELLPVAH